MKITRLESLHADAGPRSFDFLKISTDEGLIGWSEYNESFGGKGVTETIRHLAPAVIGKDPQAYEAVVALLYAIRRQATGGMVQQAIGAIENALLDIKAMEIDLDKVPWYDELFTVQPKIENGHLLLPDGPGWGTEVDEQAARAHPPRQ
jgi:L-alanine-DL-glutamate epimerase-like enolase superfamily enzyme